MTGCIQYVFYSIENIKKRMFKREKLFYLILSYPSLLDFFPPNGTEIPTNPLTELVFLPKNM